MSDMEKNNPELEELDDEDEPVVVMTDEEGNEYYYREELIIPVGAKRFAILAPLEDDDFDCEGCGSDTESGDCGCGCVSDMDETDVFIARIEIDEDGEEIYVDPTDEEFEEVSAAYEKLIAEDEE